MNKDTAPFDVILYDTEDVEVTNRFSGQSYVLTPLEVAIYDTTLGAEMFEDYTTMQKGLSWFREFNPEAYMVLLD